MLLCLNIKKRICFEDLYFPQGSVSAGLRGTDKAGKAGKSGSIVRQTNALLVLVLS